MIFDHSTLNEISMMNNKTQIVLIGETNPSLASHLSLLLYQTHLSSDAVSFLKSFNLIPNQNQHLKLLGGARGETSIYLCSLFFVLVIFDINKLGKFS